MDTSGRAKFFENAPWRKELTETYRNFKKGYQDSETFESSKSTVLAIQSEMIKSKTLLEKNFPGKVVRHFCYPWYEGSSSSDALAFDAGYQLMYYGFDIHPSQEKERKNLPLKISRIPDDFLCCLPGKDSQSVHSAWINKVWRVCRKRMKKKQFQTSAEL